MLIAEQCRELLINNTELANMLTFDDCGCQWIDVSNSCSCYLAFQCFCHFTYCV